MCPLHSLQVMLKILASQPVIYFFRSYMVRGKQGHINSVFFYFGQQSNKMQTLHGLSLQNCIQTLYTLWQTFLNFDKTSVCTFCFAFQIFCSQDNCMSAFVCSSCRTYLKVIKQIQIHQYHLCNLCWERKCCTMLHLVVQYVNNTSDAKHRLTS